MSDPAPDPVEAHKKTCAPCGDWLPCTRLSEVRAAARRPPKGSSPDHASASGQITTEPAAR